jgi:hypothetical protein
MPRQSQPRSSPPPNAAMTAAWLRSLGMQLYEQAFRDNAIDAAVLPELTADEVFVRGFLSALIHFREGYRVPVKYPSAMAGMCQ